MRDVTEYVMMDKQGKSTANFTGATASGILLSAAHGLLNGDAVVLTTTDTLPTGFSTGTIYYVVQKDTNHFMLSATQPQRYSTGATAIESSPVPVIVVSSTNEGTGTHTFTEHDIGKNINCRDYRHAVIGFASSGSANFTVKFVGAVADSTAGADFYSCPDFSAVQSNANMFDYVEVIDLEDGAAIDGDTGITLAGTDDHRQFEINVNGLDYVNAIFTAWSAGDLTLSIRLYND